MSITRTDLSGRSPSERIREFIYDTGMPLAKAKLALGLSSEDFIGWWSSPDSRGLRHKHISSLADFLAVDEDSLVAGTYEKNLVRRRIFDDPACLPESYSINAFSYLRTSAHIVKYLTLSRGQHFSDKILQKMNVSPLIFENLGNRINLLFFAEFLGLLESGGVLHARELDALPCLLFLSMSGSELGKKFSSARSYYECYEVLAENITQFDTNFEYLADLSASSFRLIATMSFAELYPINFTDPQLKRLMRYRRFLLGWFPYLAGLAPILPKVRYEKSKDALTAVYDVKFHPTRLGRSLHLL